MCMQHFTFLIYQMYVFFVLFFSMNELFSKSY